MGWGRAGGSATLLMGTTSGDWADERSGEGCWFPGLLNGCCVENSGTPALADAWRGAGCRRSCKRNRKRGGSGRGCDQGLTRTFIEFQSSNVPGLA